MSVTDKRKAHFVSVKRENPRERLQQAALELYREYGYDQTTTAEIAARAGVTERTFFRYFPDKREVLFAGDTIFIETLVRAIAEAPKDLKPIEIVMSALQSVEKLFEENRSFSVPRQEIIARTPALQERVHAKSAAINRAMTAALRERGVSEKTAGLVAQTGMIILNEAMHAWFADTSHRLRTYMNRALRELRSTLG